MLFSGCAPIFVGAGLSVGGYAVSREKSVGDSINDSKIENSIKYRIYKISPELYSNVSVIVDRGNVLLTGVVPNSQWPQFVEKEAWQTHGVYAVNNNISVGQFLNVSRILEDGAITSKIKMGLTYKKNVRSANYKIKTVNSIVYVLGVSKTNEELNLVFDAIKHVKNIKKVISYVEVMKRTS
jgi:osmotically-inducible protein OsmY